MLKAIVGTERLALYVGVLDAVLAIVDIAITAPWASVVDKLRYSRAGCYAAAALYASGAAMIVTACVYLPAICTVLGLRLPRGAVPRIAVYAVGALVLSKGQGMLFSVWSNVHKENCLDALRGGETIRDTKTAAARRRASFTSFLSPWNSITNIMNALLVGGVGHIYGMQVASYCYAALAGLAVLFCHFVMHETRPSSVEDLVSQEDNGAKVAEVQVLCRFAAAAVAPLGAAALLEATSIAISYAACVAVFTLLSVVMACLVGFKKGEAEGDEKAKKGNREKEGDEKNGEKSQEKTVLGWADVLPAKNILGADVCDRCLFGSRQIAQPSPPARGRFAGHFMRAGLFTSFTTSVREGYARVICLRAVTMGLSHAELSSVLFIVSTTAVAGFWLSDTAKGPRESRRRAAALSFLVLGLGHLAMGLAQDVTALKASAVLFGLGEAMSTGLRALVKQDYRNAHGPLREL